MNDQKNFESHNISITNRRHSELTGIDDVLSFDDSSISMHSALGDMVIEGEELKIDSFSAEKGDGKQDLLQIIFDSLEGYSIEQRFNRRL